MRQSYDKERSKVELILSEEEAERMRETMLSVKVDGTYFTVFRSGDHPQIFVREWTHQSIPYFVEIGYQGYEKLLSVKNITAQVLNGPFAGYKLAISVE